MRIARLSLCFSSLLAALVTTTPSQADPRLAGRFLVSDTNGQPLCRTRHALQVYLLATIQHDQLPPVAGLGCVIVPYGSQIEVLRDLPPFGSRMHVVWAVANTPFKRLTGYSYSVGLYDPRRYAPPGPYDALIPPIF